jgi:hypothetical protein
MQAQDALLVFGAVLAAGSFSLVHPTGRCVPRSLSLPPDQAISSEAAQCGMRTLRTRSEAGDRVCRRWAADPPAS